MFWNKYPYTDFHELNLDAILRMMKELHKDWDEFKAVNTITNAGAWDITKQYQAWTVVSDNNAGYISLKPVPAGVAITNTEYWGLIADYDILITDLSNRISALETTVGDASSGLVKDVDDLQADVTDLQADVTDLENLKLLRDHRYIFVGDSYGSQPSDAESWIALTAAAMGLTFGTDAFKVSADSRGFIGGAGLVDPSGMDWLTLLQSASASITNHNTITDIVVMGGTNDYSYTTAELETAIASFVSYCNSEYQNALIHVGMCSNVYSDAWDAAAFKILDVYQSLARKYKSCKYVNNIENALRGTDAMQADYIHPTAAGSLMLSACLSEYLKTGSGIDTYYINPANVGGYVDMIISRYTSLSSLDDPIKGRKIGNLLECMTLNNHGVLGTAITCDGTPAELVRLSGFMINGEAWEDAMATGSISDFAGNTYPATYLIKRRRLYVSVIRTNAGTPLTIPTGNVFITFKIQTNTLFA